MRIVEFVASDNNVCVSIPKKNFLTEQLVPCSVGVPVLDVSHHFQQRHCVGAGSLPCADAKRKRSKNRKLFYLEIGTRYAQYVCCCSRMLL